MADKGDQKKQDELKARGKIPEHVAIIMDGNGRWAKQKGKSRVHGHREGVESVRDIVEACAQVGVKYLTLYTFSTENWLRPVSEVDALMELLVRTIRKETETLRKNGISLRALGAVDMLPPEVRKELNESIKATPADLQSGTITPEDITEDMVEANLATAGMPAPDLLIRTGGELRVSNYLLWQIAYSELYFTPTFWPDFRRGQLYDAFRDFQDRDRRFGRVNKEGMQADGQ